MENGEAMKETVPIPISSSPCQLFKLLKVCYALLADWSDRVSGRLLLFLYIFYRLIPHQKTTPKKSCATLC